MIGFPDAGYNGDMHIHPRLPKLVDGVNIYFSEERNATRKIVIVRYNTDISAIKCGL